MMCIEASRYLAIRARDTHVEISPIQQTTRSTRDPKAPIFCLIDGEWRELRSIRHMVMSCRLREDNEPPENLLQKGVDGLNRDMTAATTPATPHAPLLGEHEERFRECRLSRC